MGNPQITFNATFSQDGDGGGGEMESGEAGEGRGRKMKQKSLTKEEGDGERPGGGRGPEARLKQRTRQSTFDFQAITPPFKARFHSRQGAQGMALGSAVPGHQLLGGLIKGFLSCPSVSPSGSEEIGPNDSLKQPSHHHSGQSHIYLLPEQWLPSPTAPASVLAPAPRSLFNMGARAVLLKFKSAHVTLLLRPSNVFPLHQSKSQYLR